ncbi:MAG: sodium-dependent transporter [Myxococcota bacterium]
MAATPDAFLAPNTELRTLVSAMGQATSTRGTFGRIGFIVAATGSAVGLGNLWKFPYMTYENEGGSFVLVYLVAVVLIGAPLMVAEILVGRRTQQSPVGAFAALAEEARGSKTWRVVGWLGIAAGAIILSYYSVVAGWTVYYFGRCVRWSLQGFTPEDAANLGATFGNFVGHGWLQIGFHGLFMALTVGVVIGGVQAGIERATKILMPTLGLLLLGLVVNSFLQPGFADAMGHLFHLGPIDGGAVLEAVGQSFFSLSLGMGAMITYGSYVSRENSVPRSAMLVVAFDTLVGLMACLVMFTIIFGIAPEERETLGAGAGILFTTLPRMFYGMPGGAVIAPLFFFLVSAAALSSTISLLEVVVAYFIDNRGWGRVRATITMGGLIFLLGVLCALSLGANTTLTEFTLIGKTTGVFNILDYAAANWLLPLGGLLTCIFVGWVLSNAITRDELAAGHGPFALHGAWKWSVRVLCPLAISAILIAVMTGTTFN